MAVGMTGKVPTAAMGELAQTLAELREMSPKRLEEIAAQVRGFHEAQAAAETAQSEATARLDAADARDGVIRTAAADAELEAAARNRLVTQREVQVSARTDEIGERERAVATRERAVTDGERRLAAAGRQLEEFKT